ncbi:MAG TPA: ATP-dependent helicase [Candidatus Saccharimonadales bacterium]
MNIFEGLNNEQRKAAEAGDGPVLIVAGPGTGKTKTLTARIAGLIHTGRARPEQILALTFTKKAAEEMQKRVGVLAPGGEPRIATFHALCNELLGSGASFVGEAERAQIIKSLPRPKALKDVGARELGLIISRAKNSPQIEDPDIAKLVRAYNKALASQNLRDFDDLLLGAYELLKENEEAREIAQKRYRYVLVDEFQDTNHLQYAILKMLMGHDNIFVIGDPNQSIYGFRGAGSGIFDEFKTDFPDHTEITLTINYRSVPQIVQLSNALFRDAPGLTPHSEDSGLARAVQVLNEYGEAEWVLKEIQRGIGGADLLGAVSDDVRTQHRRLSDFAVLYRSRPAAVVLQKMLADSGLPYQVVGDGSPYDQPHIQAIIALLRAGIRHEPIKLEGYGSAEHRLLEEELAKAKAAVPSVLVEKIIQILDIAPSSDLQQFAGTVTRFKEVASVFHYFDEIAERGFYDAAADAITLLTIHASKGLEFPYVFLIGAEEGVLPSVRGDDVEEKRLFYVAATRARERLEITHARNRGGQKAQESRFLQDLPPDVLQRHVDPDIENQIRRIAKRVAKNSQTSLF